MFPGVYIMGFECVDWNKLMLAISEGTCTPFIGAGACAGSLPLAGDLAEALADDDGYVMEHSRRDLAAVSQFMAVTHTDGNYPKAEVANFFGMHAPRPGVLERAGNLARLYHARKQLNLTDEDNPHAVLANLRSAIYLTTNYDDFMYQALNARRQSLGLQDVKRDFCRWTNSLYEQHRSPFDGGYDPSRQVPVVYHLHGHAGVPQSVVITEDDYTDFIVNISSAITVGKSGKGKKERLPGAIRSALRNNTLLFVGYGVADENLRVVLRLLSETLGAADKRLNVAIQLGPEHGLSDSLAIKKIHDYLERRYQWSLRLQVYWGEARDFASELRRQMKARKLPRELYAA
jgi:SIR2-like domain